MSLKVRINIWKITKMLLVLLIIVYVVRKNGGARMVQQMADAKLGWMFLSALAFFASIILGSIQWHLLLRLQNLRYSIWETFKTYYMGMFFNAAIFNLAGDALRVYKLRRQEMDMTSSFVATFMDRFMGLTILSAFSVVAVIVMWQKQMLSWENYRMLLGMSTIVFGCFGIGAAAISSRRFAKLFNLLFNLIGLKKIEDIYGSINKCMLEYRRQWPTMIGVIAVSATVHSLRVLGHFLCALALGIHIHLAFFFCSIPIISLVAVIPLNLGGWGLPQGVGTALYKLSGVIREFRDYPLTPETLTLAAGTVTFLPAIVFYIIMLMGGLFFILDSNRK